MLTLTDKYNYRNYNGAVEIIIKDKTGKIIQRIYEPNIIKIFAKEMLSHTLPYSKVWVPASSSGSGAWVDSGIDVDEEFAPKYFIFGASFDDDGLPLDVSDSRYYELDTVTDSYVAVKPNVGADNDGDLINPIPITDPGRPLKKVESISYRSSYQPADSPLLDDSVRAVNNVLVLETTLRIDEYNGFGTSSGDFFTITEVGLAGGKAIDEVGTCECNPKFLFLEGVGGAKDVSLLAIASGTSTISLDSSVAVGDLDVIKEGDQIYIVAAGADSSGASEPYDELDQVSPFYLVTAKTVGGRDIVLDRTPMDSDGNAITGEVGVYRSSLRLFSQRILNVPFKKSSDVEIVCRWLIYFA